MLLLLSKQQGTDGHLAVPDRDPYHLRTMRTPAVIHVVAVWTAAVTATAAAQNHDPFSAIRHVNLSRGGTVWVGFGGQARERVESWTNFNFGAVPPPPFGSSDVFALTRLFVSADLHAGSHLRLFAQGKSSFSTPRDLAGGRRSSDVDEVDVHQLYAELRTSASGATGGVVSLRGGRLEMAYGRERLVSALDWGNTKRAFEGVTAAYSRSSATLAAFWARPVVVRLYQADRRDSTTTLFGVYGTMQAARIATGVEFYGIGQYRDSNATGWNGTAGRERRYTVGARLWGPTRRESTLDLEGEAALQFGKVGANSIQASMVTVQVGYTFRRVARTPRLYVNLDYASGDAAPGGDVGTFSQLNPQPHPFLGFADIAGRQNAVDVSGGGAMRVWRTLEGAFAYHVLRRASANDAFYALSGAVSRAPSFGTSKRVATELDLTVRWPIDAHKLLFAGWSHVWAGEFIRQGGGPVGADKPIDFVYLMAQYTL